MSVESKSTSKSAHEINSDKAVTVEKSQFKSPLQVNIDKAVNTAQQRSRRNPLYSSSFVNRMVLGS